MSWAGAAIEMKKAELRLLKTKLDFQNEKLRVLTESRDDIQKRCEDLAAEILDLEHPYLFGLRDLFKMFKKAGLRK